LVRLIETLFVAEMGMSHEKMQAFISKKRTPPGGYGQVPAWLGAGWNARRLSLKTWGK
jgi:hypothetical protein